jgi:hypothetical protein
MPKKHKKKIDLGEVIGGIIFLCLFLGLVWLGIFYDSNVEYTSSFFEDVSEAMKWQSR